MLHEVVIVGGGFGGVRVAKILSKWDERIHITLIDKSRYETFYPNLYEAATADIPEPFGHLAVNFYDLKNSSIYPLEDIFLNDLNVTVLEKEVVGINFKKHKILFKDSEARSYDVLVLAAGSETNYFNMPGTKERVMPIKSFFDALAIRNAVDEAFATLPKNHIVQIVIGGGGFTGCELAAEMAGYMKKLAKIHGRPEYYSECWIIEAGEALLGGASPALQKKTKERLDALGIKFVLNSAVKSLADKKVILADGKEMPYDVLVWAAGVKANNLVKIISEAKLKKASCAAVDKFLRILPYENVFGVGDMTYCVDEKTGKSLPMTASVAIREAKYAAENIKRMILKKPLVNYRPHHAGFIIPLGGRYALLESHGVRLSGFLPWAAKQMITLHYWGNLLGWRRAFGLWKNGLEIYAQND